MQVLYNSQISQANDSLAPDWFISCKKNFQVVEWLREATIYKIKDFCEIISGISYVPLFFFVQQPLFLTNKINTSQKGDREGHHFMK